MSTPADPQAVLDAIKDSHEEVRLAEVVEPSWRPFRRAASLLNKESSWCGVISGKPEKGSRVMGVDDLKSLYLSELQEICDCEAQIAERLPKVAASAGSVELRTVIRQHARQSMLHWQKVEAILRRHGAGPKPGVDEVAAALVRKAGQVMCGMSDPDLRDAALIASVRRVTHHQVAAYSAAEGYAEALYLAIDQQGLLAALQEEQFTDRRLAGLQDEVNQLALLVNPPCY